MPVCDDAPKKITLSWSKLKAYEACHKRSQLLQQGKKSKIIDGRGFLPGNLADSAMRTWLTRGEFDAGGMQRLIPELWESWTGPEAEYRIDWKGDPRKDQVAVVKQVVSAVNILEPILMEKVVPYSFKPEYRFTSTVGVPGLDGESVNIELFGAVDVAVCIDEGRYGIYDLKISERADYLRSTLGQLIFYDLAFKGHTGLNPVEHEFWAPMLPLQDKPKPAVIALDVTNEHRMQMISRIIDYCHGVWAGDWALTPDVNECYYCPVKHACPRWVNPVTKDEQGKNRMSFYTPDHEVMESKNAN